MVTGVQMGISIIITVVEDHTRVYVQCMDVLNGMKIYTRKWQYISIHLYTIWIIISYYTSKDKTIYGDPKYEGCASYNGDPTIAGEPMVGGGIFMLLLPVFVYGWFKCSEWQESRNNRYESQELISRENDTEQPSYSESYGFNDNDDKEVE